MSVTDPRFPHLPPGRKPGPQSRRATTSRRLVGCVAGFIGFVFVLVTAAFVLVAGAGPGDGVGALPFAGLVLLLPGLVLVGLLVRRRPRGMRSAGLELVLAETEVRRGTPVAATVTVGDAIGGPVELHLICTERYDVRERRSMAIGEDPDGPARTTRDHVEHESAVPVPAGAGTHELSIAVPRDAPYSHEGECLSFGWRLSLVERRRGDHRDARTDEPVWVLP